MGKEIKVRYYGRQGAEELYKNIENHRVYVRQPANVPEIVFWLSSNKWQGGYEADCPIKEGITIVVVDKENKELFRETLVKDDFNGGTSASKAAPFLYDATRDCANEIARLLRLSSHNRWFDWLVKLKNEYKYDWYNDNWLYCNTDILKSRVTETRSILGRKYKVVIEDRRHTICNASWKVVFLVEKGDIEATEICGYIFD